MKSLIATLTYFLFKCNWKRKLEECFFGCQGLGSQTGIPVFQTTWIRHCFEHIPCLFLLFLLLILNMQMFAGLYLINGVKLINIVLTRPVSIPGKEKINLNFYFHTLLWRLKRFYESLKGFRLKRLKTFLRTLKKCENSNFYFNTMLKAGRVNFSLWPAGKWSTLVISVLLWKHPHLTYCSSSFKIASCVRRKQGMN